MGLKKIYLIKGSTGDYEDTYRWITKGYTDKYKAEQYCKNLNDIAQKSHAHNFGTAENRNDSRMLKVQDAVAEELRQLDSKASVSGSGTSYRIEELEVDID